MNDVLSTNSTEEASKLRANAAASVIQGELDYRTMDRNLSKFKITSTTSEELTNSEFKQLVDLRSS